MDVDRDVPAWKALDEYLSTVPEPEPIGEGFEADDDSVIIDMSFDDPLLRSLERLNEFAVRDYTCRVCAESFKWQVHAEGGEPRIIYRPCTTCVSMRTHVLSD